MSLCFPGFSIPNFTQVPNEIFDYWMALLDGSELKVLMCIIRKTLGWHKEKDAISASQIEKVTGISRRSVIYAIEKLLEKCLIIKEKSFAKEGDQNVNRFSLNMSEIAPPSATIAPPRSATIAPTKETNTSYTKEKNIPPPPLKEELVKHGEHVKLKPSEYLKLCQENSKEVIDDYIERINDYCSAKGKSPYKGYAAAIRNWIRNSFNSPSQQPQNRAAMAQKYAKRVEDMYPHHPHLQIDSNGILFISGGQSPDTYIKFEDAGFIDQVNSQLRKRNLSLPQDLPCKT